jgi:hypothetical protein
VAAGHFNGTVVGELLAECDIGAGEAPHVLLAVLWASMVTAPMDCLNLVTTHLHHRSSGALDAFSSVLA